MRASFLAALAFFQMCIGSALAGPVSYPELADLLPGRTDVTYADLVRLILPSADGSQTTAADRPARIRSIAGGDTMLVPGDIRGLSSVSLRSGGHDRLALLLDMNDPPDALGLAILALFDVSKSPRCQDAIDVSFDRATFFADPAWLPIGTGDDLLVTVSTHSNSSQTYEVYSPILALDDRLEPVDSIFMLGERNCAYVRTQSVDFGKGAGEPFADIVATVTDESVASDEACSDSSLPMPPSRTFKVTYRWDASSREYVPDSDAFEVLARENEERL